MSDRAYWEKRLGKNILMVDEMIGWLHCWDPNLVPHYSRPRSKMIGLKRAGLVDNFVTFWPARNGVRVEPKLPFFAEIEESLRKAGLDVLEYRKDEPRYRIRVTVDEFPQHRPLLRELLRMAHGKAAILVWGTL